MSICLECFECKLIPHTVPVRVRCAEHAFKGTLSLDHPFITLKRDCPKFNTEDEKIVGD